MARENALFGCKKHSPYMDTFSECFSKQNMINVCNSVFRKMIGVAYRLSLSFSGSDKVSPLVRLYKGFPNF